MFPLDNHVSQRELTHLRSSTRPASHAARSKLPLRFVNMTSNRQNPGCGDVALNCDRVRTGPQDVDVDQLSRDEDQGRCERPLD